MHSIGRVVVQQGNTGNEKDDKLKCKQYYMMCDKKWGKSMFFQV